MPTFDITSEVDWPEVKNAIDQADRELRNRFDFKGVESDIQVDQKGSTLTIKIGRAHV